MAGTLAAPSPPKLPSSAIFSGYLGLDVRHRARTYNGCSARAPPRHEPDSSHHLLSRHSLARGGSKHCAVCSTHSQCTQLEPERAEGPMDLWWSTPPLLHPLAAAVPSSNQQHRSQAVKDGVVSTCGSARKAPRYLRPASEGCSLAAHAQYCTVL